MKINITNFVVKDVGQTDGSYYKGLAWKRRHELNIPPASEEEAEFRMMDKIVIPTSAMPEYDNLKQTKKRGKKK